MFVEVGPQAVLTGLTGQILAGQPHVAVASDVKSRPGLVQLAHLLGQLLVAGVPARLDRLYQGRGVRVFDLAKLGSDTGKRKPPATAWVVNGVRSRPINGPEPRLLGHPLPEGAKDAPPKLQPAPTIAAGAAPQPILSRLSSPSIASSTPRPMMNNTEITPALPTPSANGHPPPPEGVAQVMMRFQDVMARFLETQRSVMLGFLGTPGGSQAPSPIGPVAYPLNGNGHPTPAVANRLPTEGLIPRSVPVPPASTVKGSLTDASTVSPPPEANGKHDPPAPITTAKPAAGPLERDGLLARLLELISDRTGYPKEALSIDLDLEADLGIDSIKRVEILGALAESIEAGADGKQPNLEMEKLSVIKTLRGIADYVMETLAEPISLPSANGTPKSALAPAAQTLHAGARQGEIQRLVVRLIDYPLPLRPRFSPPTGTILLTDDQQGTARELADRLSELDIKTALVRMATSSEAKGEGVFAADLTDPNAVTDLLGRVREKCGSVSGLIHLIPLMEPPEAETPEQRMRREVKSLYLLTRGLETEIREAGKAGSAVLLAVTAMGGKMGFGDLPDNFFAGHGGVAGFTKCLGYEWPEVTVRVVDVDGETPATHLAEHLLGELGDPDGPFEVGRAGDRRVAWQVEPGPLEKESQAVELGPDSTVLITGGARGITAKVALELATRYKSRLVLVGSSPAPADEPADTAGLTTAAELKAAIMNAATGGKARRGRGDIQAAPQGSRNACES